MLPREALITIYKTFGYTFTASSNEKFESLALSLTGTLRSTSKEKLHQELGPQSLQAFTESPAFFIKFSKINLESICLI